MKLLKEIYKKSAFHKYCVDETINEVSQLCFIPGVITGNKKEAQTFILSIFG